MNKFIFISKLSRVYSTETIRKPLNNTGLNHKDVITMKVGETKSYCRCWLSKKFPICDVRNSFYSYHPLILNKIFLKQNKQGAHKAYNKEFNDNVGPVRITVVSEENQSDQNQK